MSEKNLDTLNIIRLQALLALPTSKEYPACMTDATIKNGYSLLAEIYSKRKFCACGVKYGGEEKEDDELCFHWGSVTCYIERNEVTLSYSTDDDLWKETKYDITNLDALIECSACIRRLIGEIGKKE